MWRKTVTIATLMLLAATAFAQKGERMRDKVRERVKAIRIAKLIEVLDLDEPTTARMMPIVNRSYDDIGAVAKDSGEARRDLEGVIASDHPDAARIDQLIDRLVANRAKVEKLEGEMIREVRKVLSPTQQAKLVLRLPEINREIQQQIRRAARGEKGDKDLGPPQD